MKINRFSLEEKRTVELIEEFLGDQHLHNTWILFTRGDELSEDLTIEKCISETEELKRVLQRFNNRYHVFNNIKHDPDQVRRLIEKIKANQSSPRLNLVLCGSNRVLKSSISDLILDQKKLSADSRSVCVKREAEVCGRLISLVELPALYSSQLSEEEVMRETLRCVSLCDPGVHAFLLVNPAGPLTDEDKGELEKIQMIFGSKFTHYTISVITTESQQQSVELNKATKQIPETFQRHCVSVLDDSMGSVLMNEVDLMLKLNSGSCYTSGMYLEAQVETQLRYKTENEELRETIRLLSMKKETQESSSDTGGLRIVLMGKTGVGKSASGNIILRKEVFKELISSKSVTSVCQKQSAEVRRRRVTVIDTPGLFDTSISNKEILIEIVKCITMAAPGPHVFLLVLTVGRFTQEEKDAVKMIQDRFGEESRRYTMVLFTRGDDLRKMSIEDYIKYSDHSLQNIINQCGNRYHVFNNRNTEDQTQVTDLLEKIDSMVAVNGGSCYTNEMFQKVEKALREEQERILRKKKEEIEREKEELRAKHEAEQEKLKMMLTEEQQNLLKERKEKEEEFQKKEAQIKEETNEERKKELDEKLKEDREAFNKVMEVKEQACKKKMKEDQQYEKEKYEREKEEMRKRKEEEAREEAEKKLCDEIERATKVGGAVGGTVGGVLGGALGLLGGPIGAAAGGAAGATVGAAVGAAVGGFIGWFCKR
ncbi:GTPase IMAP family member 8-like isoform X2 [Astyanax mexicanus]|uniref:GTPase IMAP family member 8-like isoform X2 n=1 Tax=Astyanax mexicanus TaxID=7994 RepID=UPI0020CB3A37|nr:GTPase IMAP family member 8-like isoform X2 [Astyanax mexicanus]